MRDACCMFYTQRRSSTEVLDLCQLRRGGKRKEKKRNTEHLPKNKYQGEVVIVELGGGKKRLRKSVYTDVRMKREYGSGGRMGEGDEIS